MPVQSQSVTTIALRLIATRQSTNSLSAVSLVARTLAMSLVVSCRPTQQPRASILLHMCARGIQELIPISVGMNCMSNYMYMLTKILGFLENIRLANKVVG